MINVNLKWREVNIKKIKIKVMLELNQLVKGKKYIHGGETKFTYIGQGDSELSRHNVILECGTESFLVYGDVITEVEK